MDKREKKIFDKFKKKIGKIKVKGIRLYDPRMKKFRRPGNDNPALILRDLLIRSGLDFTEEDDKEIKKWANFCDKKLIGLSGVLECKKKKSSK